MKKNIFCVVLALVLMTCSFAMAEAVPSVTMPQVTVAEIVSSTGVVIPAEVQIAVVAEPTEAQIKTVETVKVALVQLTQEEAKPVAEYFGEEVMTAAVAKIVEVLPEIKIEDVKVENFVVDEIVPVQVAEYDVEYGELEVTMQFVTEYEDDTVLIAMIGLIEGEEIVWTPLPAVVSEGLVKITYTPELLEAMMNGEALLALLRAE